MAVKRNILVVGGGAGGVGVASSLSQSLDPSQFSIQLVTEREFYIHYPALLRVSTTSEGDWEDLALPTYDKLFAPDRAGEVIYGKVTSVVDGTAHLEDGQTLSYDWLVLATGSKWDNAGPIAFPIDRQATHQWLADWHAKILRATNIVVIGGGAAGIEMCGEIKHYFPDKKVTLVHGQNQLLNDTYPTHFRRQLLDAVQDRGIEVVLRDRASVPEGEATYTSITTQNGVHIPADLVIGFRGGRLDTAYLKSLDPSVLTPTGAVKILPTMQVPLSDGMTNVFALGDIIDTTQQKTLAKVPTQVAVVAANILSATKGVLGTKTYNGDMEVMVVTLGPTGGKGWLPLLWGIILGNFMTRTLKAKTLFVYDARKTLVAPEPSIFAKLFQMFF